MRKETVLKIVGLLRRELGKGFTILEISKLLKIGYRPAYNHISGLEEKDIILVKKVGSSKQCFLNLENAQARHYLQEVDLVRKEELFSNQKLKTILEEIIPKITNQIIASLHSIVLFGSHAKGTATKSSDIDLLFIVSNIKDKTVRERIERACASYQHSHNVKISPLITDIEEFKKMLKSKEMNVGQETKEYGIALYGSEQFWRLISWEG